MAEIMLKVTLSTIKQTNKNKLQLRILFLFPSGHSECWASNTTDEKGIVNLDLYTIIRQISTKQTITFHLKLLIIKHEKNTTTYDTGKPGPGLGQEQKCDRVKLVNEILTIPFKNCISNGNTAVFELSYKPDGSGQ